VSVKPPLPPAAVIPARYGSTRLPGKSLADIAGRALILRVLDRVREANCFDPILVATDDERIKQVVEEDGGIAVMTSMDCRSGTDRIAEVCETLERDVIINVQGDEPLIEPQLLAKLARCLIDDPTLGMATACAPFPTGENPANPNRVKVVTDLDGNALYFSRCAIPFHREKEGISPYRLHLGVYAYRKETLLRIVKWPTHPLEAAECLEQLRPLVHGVKIRVVEAPEAMRGVDTPEDLEAVRKVFANR
jgi:3-deoxy-manno-octulosonate cytidylyltransferase (CMP-KDO synthetase)